MGAIAETHLMDGLPYPINIPYSQAHTVLDRSLTYQLKTYDVEEPPAKREKASPLGIVRYIVDAAATTTDPKTFNISNLVQRVLYF